MMNRSRARRAIAIATTAVTAAAGFGLAAAQPAFSAGSRAAASSAAVSRAVLTSITPAVGSVDGGTVVSLAGSKLKNVEEVLFGGQPATRFVVLSDVRIIAVAPPGTVGDAAVKVISADGAAQSPKNFGYRTELAGEIEDTTAGAAGGTKVLMTVTGGIGASAKEFAALKVTAKVGTLPATVAWKDADSVWITVPKSSTAGPVPVRLLQNGYAGPVTTGTVTYLPQIAKITPPTVSIDGGTDVTILGDGFLGVNTADPAAVTFGGVPALWFGVVSANRIEAVSPPGAAGAARVKISVSGGDSADTTASKIGYRGPLGIVTTDQFVRAGGGPHVLAVTGGTLGATAAEFAAEQVKVRIGVSTTLLATTWVDENRLSVNLPSRISGSLDLRIVRGGLEGPVAELGVAPVVSSISSNSDNVAGGLSVRITTAGADATTAFTFGGVAATCTPNSNAVVFTCAVPPAAQAGPAVIAFTTGGGATSKFTAAATFNYIDLD
jgi:hypothetical protein